MPRISRRISNSGIYHIIVRGINKQDIFYDKQDYNKFLKEICNTKEKYQYEVLAYCLMPNHVHMEIKDNKSSLAFIMRSLMVAYVSYFNKKYERIGHLFQDRFLSKPVENNEYVLDLQRYIHQNPEKANISSKEKYMWSSYKEYMSKNGLVDTQHIMKLLDNDTKKFVEYNSNNKYRAKDLHEFEMNSKLTDEQAKEIIERALQISNLQEIQKYNKIARQEIFNKFKDIEGISYAQMARVIGINRKIIEREITRSVPKRTRCPKKNRP